jgi:hypothetical protein
MRPADQQDQDEGEGDAESDHCGSMCKPPWMLAGHAIQAM